jgi:cytoplasmic iron level regulating protein YaaA (DUF328/UPF0246 family)
MISLLSPAKTLDFETPPTTKEFTYPAFLDDSEYLIEKLKKLSVKQIRKLMGLSEDLGQLNYDRFQSWVKEYDANNGKQSLLAFKGDVYLGLAAETLNEAQLNFAQDHVLMLSGLYGLLKPLDLMLPYRLEMGTSFAVTPKKTNLYKYWGDKLTETLNAQLASHSSKTIINLASGEYFKAINTKKINGELITIDFKDWKDGDYKMIGFFAKKARGLMTRFIIDHNIDNPEDIKGFDTDGYSYNQTLTTNQKWVFTRKQ